MHEMTAGDSRQEPPSLGTPLDRVLSDLRPVVHRVVDERWPGMPLSPSQARLLRIVRLRPGIASTDVPSELREDPIVAATVIEELVHEELLTSRTRPRRRGAQSAAHVEGPPPRSRVAREEHGGPRSRARHVDAAGARRDRDRHPRARASRRRGCGAQRRATARRALDVRGLKSRTRATIRCSCGGSATRSHRQPRPHR